MDTYSVRAKAMTCQGANIKQSAQEHAAPGANAGVWAIDCFGLVCVSSSCCLIRWRFNSLPKRREADTNAAAQQSPHGRGAGEPRQPLGGGGGASGARPLRKKGKKKPKTTGRSSLCFFTCWVAVPLVTVLGVGVPPRQKRTLTSKGLEKTKTKKQNM